jgi:hypothetical protein
MTAHDRYKYPSVGGGIPLLEVDILAELLVVYMCLMDDKSLRLVMYDDN